MAFSTKQKPKLCIFAGCGRLPQSAYHRPCSRSEDFCASRTCHAFRSKATATKRPVSLEDRLVGQRVVVELRGNDAVTGGLKALLGQLDLRTDEERLAQCAQRDRGRASVAR